MKLSYIVFDLDDTLYPADNGLWEALSGRIIRFMVERLHIAPDLVSALREKYFTTYGTTLRGLMIHHPQVDPDEFLSFVHDVDINRWVTPNPALERMLAALPVPKAIFTNADTSHAMRTLNRLGVAHHFNAIVDIKAMGFENKPRPKAYDALLSTLGVPPNELVLVEDSVRNIKPARALGMTTILVGGQAANSSEADFHVSNLLEVGDILRRLLHNSP